MSKKFDTHFHKGGFFTNPTWHTTVHDRNSGRVVAEGYGKSSSQARERASDRLAERNKR